MILLEMNALLDEYQTTELVETFDGMFALCDEAKIPWEGADAQAFLSEVDAWLESNELSSAHRAQLEGFGQKLKHAVFKTARTIGKVHHAYQRAKSAYRRADHAVRKFSGGLKHAARSGYAAGHVTQARAQQNRLNRRKRKAQQRSQHP